MAEKPPKQLDWSQRQGVHYCIPIWMRDLQIKAAIKRIPGRFRPSDELRPDPIAIVCYGPSLNETWEKIRDFKYVMTCSGSHKFLVDRGIIPTWHVEVDPRPHKVKLIGKPCAETEYLIASACHPAVFDHLEGHKVKLWHVYDANDNSTRIIPRGDWSFTGGCGVGLRCLVLARAMGFTDLHIFGMDGSEGKTGKHAAEHPNQAGGHSETVYNGVTYYTTPAFLEAARTTPYELDQLPGVKYTFYGEGLVQAMMRDHKPNPAKGVAIGAARPELISPEFLELNRKLHESRPDFGAWSTRHAPIVVKLVESIKAKSVLDYGCGKGMLADALPFPIWEYDPAIPGKEELPRPADLVICADVLEHVEPEKLPFVLDDLKRCVKQVGYFVIHTGPSSKQYADGRNTHLIQRDKKWWEATLKTYFDVGGIFPGDNGNLFHVVVGPRKNAAALALSDPKRRRWDVLESWVKEYDWKNGAEIGVKDGRTFLHLLSSCPTLNMIGVDLFEPRPGLESEGGESHIEANLPECEQKLRDIVESKYQGRAKLIKGYSTEVAKNIPDQSLDFVFIDADHRYESVRADIEAWKPKVKPGGRLAGHDAQDKFPGVLQAINELLPGWVLTNDSVWKYQL